MARKYFWNIKILTLPENIFWNVLKFFNLFWKVVSKKEILVEEEEYIYIVLVNLGGVNNSCYHLILGCNLVHDGLDFNLKGLVQSTDIWQEFLGEHT